jgi:DhnA family fructose-bisphosphate aldolase class Ia
LTDRRDFDDDGAVSIPRLHRLFASDGNCFDVAVDHGFFNEAPLLGGIERLDRALDTLIAAAPDAIQLTPGQAKRYQERPGHKPALVLRTDTANIYGSSLPSYVCSKMIDGAVETAVRIDAACVVVNLFLLPNQPDLHGQCVRNVMQLRAECEKWGMPLMVEPLVMQPNEKAGGYMVDGDVTKIVPLVRQAVELGADVIKADPTDNIEDYPAVLDTAAGVPVLVRGGGKVPVKEILERTAALMAVGANGIVYGRNVIQHEHPAELTRALMAVVHDGADADQALKLLP